MKYKSNVYEFYAGLVRDKNRALMQFMDEQLCKLSSMFVYENLPDTIPGEELERILLTSGTAFVTEVNGKLYALRGTPGGEPDEYERPTEYTVANPFLKLSKAFKITDGVLFRNNHINGSMLPILGKYGVLTGDALLSLNTASILSRITLLISASDTQTKKAADEFVKSILNGNFAVIGDSPFFEGVKMQTAGNGVNTVLQQLIETLQYFKSSFYNEIGLRSNWNVKRERLNLGEIETNEDITLPQVDDMLRQRQNAVDELNTRYNLNVTLSLGSSWKLNHENAEMIDDMKPDDMEQDETAGNTGNTGNDTEQPGTDGNNTEQDGNTGNDTEQANQETDEQDNKDNEPTNND